MPQAVIEYAKSKDFAKVDRIKKTILRLYRQDITRFAKGYESKVLAIFDEIPGQLSKKEKKFSITSLEKDAKMRTYENAFMWLTKGMIINDCHNATDPTMGLSMYLDSASQKCYMLGFKYDALLLADSQNRAYVIKEIETVYEKMLNKDATSFWETELGESDFGGAGSLCHGWSAMPVYYLWKLRGQS